MRVTWSVHHHHALLRQCRREAQRRRVPQRGRPEEHAIVSIYGQCSLALIGDLDHADDRLAALEEQEQARQVGEQRVEPWQRDERVRARAAVGVVGEVTAERGDEVGAVQRVVADELQGVHAQDVDSVVAERRDRCEQGSEHPQHRHF